MILIWSVLNRLRLPLNVIDHFIIGPIKPTWNRTTFFRKLHFYNDVFHQPFVVHPNKKKPRSDQSQKNISETPIGSKFLVQNQEKLSFEFVRKFKKNTNKKMRGVDQSSSSGFIGWLINSYCGILTVITLTTFQSNNIISSKRRNLRLVDIRC